jgi:peptide/nickel transport system permease protein
MAVGSLAARGRRRSGIAGDPVFLVSGAVVLAFVAVALLGPWIAPQDPNQLNPGQNYAPPSPEHWFGTDRDGRDLFSRLVVGTRMALFGAVAVVLIDVGLGTAYGLIAGYAGGRIDGWMMRAGDVLLSFPALIMGVLFVAVFGPGLLPVVVGLAIVYMPTAARVVRSQVRIQKKEQYVQAGRMLGFSPARIAVLHILPNCSSQIIVQASIVLAYAVVDLAALSFLGLGVQPPTPDWGNMLAEAQRSMILAPWVAVFPAVAIILLVLAWNVFGARLRYHLDPTERR